MNKKLLALVLALVMMLSLAACGGNGGDATTAAGDTTASGDTTAADDAASDLAYIQGKGEMIIGYTEFAPMNYKDDNGEFVGFETEFAKAVCKELGVEAKFQLISWEAKETELKSKNIDCIWNGLTITPEREESM